MPRRRKTFAQRLRRLLTGRSAERIKAVRRDVDVLRRELGTTLELLGAMEARRVAELPADTPIAEAEFRVYSQFGDDGIIQFLIANLPTPAVRTFVEFGVDDYYEANTRFLLVNKEWRGLVLDGRPDLDDVVVAQNLLPMHYRLETRSAYITAENIDELIRGAGFAGEIGLLSVDIDGNDYWVWRALTCVDPQIVVVEYNAVLGAERAVTIPYDPGFARQAAHSSCLYFGASLAALCRLAADKGYVFVGCNEAGNNAYFVRGDLAAPFHKPGVREGFRDGRFRESRDEHGRLSRLGGADRLAAIAHLPVVDVESGATIALRELA